MDSISINNDRDWKNYVYKKYRQLVKVDKVEAQIFWSTAFESTAPFSACFDKIKDIPGEYGEHIEYESLKIPTADGIQLDAWFFPCGHARGTLIVLHGAGYNMADSFRRSVYLLEHRYQLLLYNARYWNFSQNPATYMGFIGKDLEDIGAVTGYLKTRPGLSTGKIGLLGYSYGALKCLLYTPGREDIKVVISDSTPCKLSWFDHIMMNDLDFMEKLKRRMWERYGIDIYAEKYDVSRQVEKISPTPLLFLHGKHDHTIPVKATKNLYKLARQPREMHIFQHSGHCEAMLTHDKEEYIRVVTGFLARYLHREAVW